MTPCEAIDRPRSALVFSPRGPKDIHRTLPLCMPSVYLLPVVSGDNLILT